MKKPYLLSIEYIRGISMLGVVAIHIGSQYLTNPTPNLFFVSLYETASRFSVPIFFFISAFGLFYKIDLSEPFDYIKFLRRRFKAVLIPYLLWSVFYIVHDNFFYGSGIPAPSYALEILFFGLAKYQLYFLVILIWFYLLMSLWIKILRVMTPAKLFLLLIVQIIFDYFSSYSVVRFEFINSLPSDSILKLFLMWRMNYLVLHYAFIFLLGGFFAVHSEKFFKWLAENKKIISAGFFLTLIILMGYFYYLVLVKNFSPIEAVNTAHQLSPPGIFYTIAASIFFFMLFENFKLGKFFEGFFGVMGKNSYFIYLFHPLAITYINLLFAKFNLVITATNSIIFYLLTILISLAVSLVWQKLK